MINCGPPSSIAGQGAKVGDYAILFGNGGPSLEIVAALLGTMQSNITCDFTRRIERRYTKPPLPREGYFQCTSVEEGLHPEVLYGGNAVGSVPFPYTAHVRVVLEVDLTAISQNARAIQNICARTNRKLIGILKA